jgi:hypothetical protein
METDEEIERKIYSEVGWSYFGNGLDLIEILDLTWKKLDPLKDIAPDNLKYDDDTVHIYFKVKSLIYCDSSHMPHVALTDKTNFSDLAIDTNAFLYSQKQFKYAAQGPSACPSDWNDLDWVNVDITKDITDDIAQALIEENNEFKEKLVAFNGEEEFLKTIKHKKLKQVMTKTWKKNKHFWV